MYLSEKVVWSADQLKPGLKSTGHCYLKDAISTAADSPGTRVMIYTLKHCKQYLTDPLIFVDLISWGAHAGHGESEHHT